MSSVRRPQTRTYALPSVLDRLLDDHPDEPQRDVALLFDLPEFKAALARDLEALLNTRVMEFRELAEQFPEAAKSVIRYGIPDLSSLSLLSPKDRERLRAEVQHAIERYESRLSNVQVTLNMPDKPQTHLDRMLNFRVDATLIIHPRRPPVAFDATLQLSSFAYQVRGHS
jgi:type VI secretion system protein ImpF